MCWYICYIAFSIKQFLWTTTERSFGAFRVDWKVIFCSLFRMVLGRPLPPCLFLGGNKPDSNSIKSCLLGMKQPENNTGTSFQGMHTLMPGVTHIYDFIELTTKYIYCYILPLRKRVFSLDSLWVNSNFPLTQTKRDILAVSTKP